MPTTQTVFWSMLPAVAEALKGEESHALAEVEIFVGKQVKVQIEPLYNREQFDVVMM